MAVTPSTSDFSVTVSRYLPAPPDRVFAAWTTAEALKQWSAPGDYSNPVVEVDFRVGGRFRLDIAAPNGTTHRVSGVYRTDSPASFLSALSQIEPIRWRAIGPEVFEVDRRE